MSSDKSKGWPSNVDGQYRPELKGKAKAAFDQKDMPKQNAIRSDGVGDSIRKTAPVASLDMPGGGSIKAQYAGERVQKEKAAEKLKQDAAKMAAQKLTKTNALSQNNSKSSDKGRE